MSSTPVALYCCYASADAASYSELKKHLGLLLYQDRIRLLRRAGRLTIEGSLEQASPTEQDTAKQISRELGGLPLAIDQAGAYIEETSSPLSAYLHIYQRRRAELLSERRDLLGEHPDSVATTVSLAGQRVQQRQPAAAQLLPLCAFLTGHEMAMA